VKYRNAFPAALRLASSVSEVGDRTVKAELRDQMWTGEPGGRDFGSGQRGTGRPSAERSRGIDTVVCATVADADHAPP